MAYTPLTQVIQSITDGFKDLYSSIQPALSSLSSLKGTLGGIRAEILGTVPTTISSGTVTTVTTVGTVTTAASLTNQVNIGSRDAGANIFNTMNINAHLSNISNIR